METSEGQDWVCCWQHLSMSVIAMSFLIPLLINPPDVCCVFRDLAPINFCGLPLISNLLALRPDYPAMANEVASLSTAYPAKSHTTPITARPRPGAQAAARRTSGSKLKCSGDASEFLGGRSLIFFSGSNLRDLLFDLCMGPFSLP